jgi:putative Mg2+ transporter-C (MgtC) family protein
VTEIDALLRLVLATAFGALLGLEREGRDKPAGVRTFAIVALGAALFSVISITALGLSDAGARIPAQIVTGVGFLGAGAIIQQRGNVVGLTTAAGIWAAAAIGMGFGFGLFIISAGGTLILLTLLRVVGRLEARVAIGAQPSANASVAGSRDGSAAPGESADGDAAQPSPEGADEEERPPAKER